MSEKLMLCFAALFILTACKPDKPSWEKVCVRSHTEMIMLPMYINKTTMWRLQPVIRCDAYQTTCVIPDKWQGEDLCPPINEESIRNEK